MRPDKFWYFFSNTNGEIVITYTLDPIPLIDCADSALDDMSSYVLSPWGPYKSFEECKVTALEFFTYELKQKQAELQRLFKLKERACIRDNRGWVKNAFERPNSKASLQTPSAVMR